MGNAPVTKTNRFGTTRTLKSSRRQLEYMAEYRKRPENIARQKVQTAAWRKEHPNRARLPLGVTSSEYWKDVNARRKDARAAWDRGHLLKRYGLTADQYQQMYAQQGGVCAMPFCERRGDQTRLTIDHDHVTGEVRGLLCVPCNGFLGFFERNPNLVRQVRTYLRRTRAHATTRP